jgi:hypothetical protein
LEYIFKNTTPSDDRFRWQYEELFNPDIKAEIAIFGSSKSVYGINPQILEDNNISVFNFGLNDANAEFIYKWYSKFFRRYYPKPKLILFEVSWLMFNEKWMWRRFEQDSRYFKKKEFFKEIFNSQNDLNTTFFNRFHIFNRTVGDGSIMDSSYNGYTPQPVNNNKIKSMPDSITFNPNKQRKFFELLLKMLKTDNLNVIFIILPEKINKQSLSYKTLKKNTDYIQKKTSNYKLLNYQNEFKSDSLFNDWRHLNIKGAKLISEKIKEILKSDYNLQILQ